MVSKAEVGRFDGEYKTIAFNEGDNLSVLLNKAGITLHDGEGLNNDSGEDVSTSDIAVNGETYSIVGNYKQGQEPEEEEEAEPTSDEVKTDENAEEPKTSQEE